MENVSAHLITGLGIFTGLVAGVVVQLIAHWFIVRSQKQNAVGVFNTEARLNLSAVDAVVEKIETLKRHISAGQVKDAQFWISFEEFDFSATGPLNQSGHLHTMLGTDGLTDHLRVLRFFNNQRATILTEMLQNAHKQDNSLNYLGWLAKEINKHKSYIENTIRLAR